MSRRHCREPADRQGAGRTGIHDLDADQLGTEVGAQRLDVSGEGRGRGPSPALPDDLGAGKQSGEVAYLASTTPWAEAHKGSLTLELSPADPGETTLPYTGTPPLVTIAPADSAAYAAKEGVLLNDIFNAS